MSAFDFFDRISCINLPKRKDRKEFTSKQFKEQGFLDRVTWMHAPPPSKQFVAHNLNRNAAAEFGCSLSHCKTIVHGIANNAKNLLVFEDDVSFIPNAESILQEALKELRKDWAVLYLGGRPLVNTTRESKHLAKMPQRYDLAHAYAVNGDRLLDLYDFWCQYVGRETYPPHDPKWSPVDLIIARFAYETGKAYCVIPNIVYPDLLVSEIQGSVQSKLPQDIKDRWKRHLR